MPHIFGDDLAALDTIIGDAASGSTGLTLRTNYDTLGTALDGLTGSLHTRVHSWLNGVHYWLTGEDVPSGTVVSVIDGFNTSADDLISEL